MNQRIENHGMLLPYRPSNLKEKVLKLPVIGLTSQEDVLRSLTHQRQLKPTDPQGYAHRFSEVTQGTTYQQTA